MSIARQMRKSAASFRYLREGLPAHTSAVVRGRAGRLGGCGRVGDGARDFERIQDEERGIRVRVRGARDAEHGYLGMHKLLWWVFTIVWDVIQYCNTCVYVTEDADGGK